MTSVKSMKLFFRTACFGERELKHDLDRITVDDISSGEHVTRQVGTPTQLICCGCFEATKEMNHAVRRCRH